MRNNNSINFSTLFVGKELHGFFSLPSTNTYATKLLSKSNPAEGTVILTYNQTAGRGQIGSKWESAPDKNVSMSVILYPKFLAAREQFNLNAVVSLAIFDAVSLYVKDVKVKWPNDIYIGKKKVAGVLIQNTLIGKNIQSSVVGIGLNVNQTEFTSDAPNPTSLKLETEGDIDLTKIVQEIAMALEKRYLQLRSGKAKDIRREYIMHLYRFGKPFAFQRENDSYFTGIITGISSLGKLVIDTETGEEEFALKEVRFCR
jgi:BirA family biotin operon repressor/biotin-[acetyl-CoA-carboxylase] ligase